MFAHSAMPLSIELLNKAVGIPAVLWLLLCLKCLFSIQPEEIFMQLKVQGLVLSKQEA